MPAVLVKLELGMALGAAWAGGGPLRSMAGLSLAFSPRSEGSMNLPPSSHHLRCGTESEQFPLTRRMSGFSGAGRRCGITHYYGCYYISISPPRWAILSSYLPEMKSPSDALRLHEFYNSCCHQPAPCDSVQEPQLPRQS